MAVVIGPEESNLLSKSGLRRSHSQPKFSNRNVSVRTSSSASKIHEAFHQPSVHLYRDAYTSQPNPSPQDIEDPDRTSPPKLSFDISPASQFDQFQLDAAQVEDHFAFPRYDDVGFYTQAEDLEPPPSPRGLGDSYTVSPNDNTVSPSTSRPDSPLFIEHADDDTAVRAQPSRHVDYLSHDWAEEDIWESWKYITSNRGEYSNSARLENASWRTWIKAKNNLKTVSPETLNWLKDCDVTWLYGPLQTGNNSLVPRSQPLDSNGLTKSNSFLNNNKKPILKKRSMSEVMLQRSLSTSSLVKQAAAAVQAQQLEANTRPIRPRLERAATDYITFPFSSRQPTPKDSSLAPSDASSGIVSPSVERKHIHFNEKVEQCIAVDAKGEEDDDEPEQVTYPYDSDSDDGAIMMKRTTSQKRRPLLKRGPSSQQNESKTIAMLPSTKLKYREDTPEPPEDSTAMKHSYPQPGLSPSSSQETLRPSRKMFFAEEDDEAQDSDDAEDDDEGLSIGWRSGTPGPGTTGSASGLKRSGSSNNIAIASEPAGMRRTESGMFMPYEEGEPTAANGGLVGRVVDTVNTARDIAHVIWNVGWRK